jgi:hypothetical protein
VSQPTQVEELKAAATALEHADPELVRRAAADCEAGAQRDHLDGVPRGKAYVRRLRDVTGERPELGIAVGRALGLEHIVEDLLDGRSVDGVTGLGPDGAVLPPSRSDRRRRRGVVLLLLGGVVVLAGATVADSLALPAVITWTAASFVLIFVGLRDLLHRE